MDGSTAPFYYNHTNFYSNVYFYNILCGDIYLNHLCCLKYSEIISYKNRINSQMVSRLWWDLWDYLDLWANRTMETVSHPFIKCLINMHHVLPYGANVYISTIKLMNVFRQWNKAQFDIIYMHYAKIIWRFLM